MSLLATSMLETQSHSTMYQEFEHVGFTKFDPRVLLQEDLSHHMTS